MDLKNSHPYNGMLFDNKKERGTHTCCSMGESQRHYVKQQNPHSEDWLPIAWVFTWNF